MKKLDKQLVSALAIGIGAGIMMCPVTVYADEGEPDNTDDDHGEIIDGGENSGDESAQTTQNIAEAADAVSDAADAVETAQEAVPDAPEGETNGYESANAALNTAEDRISDAATEIGEAQTAVEQAKDDIEAVNTQDEIIEKAVEEEVPEIDEQYGGAESNAQKAIDAIEGINTDTDSIDDANSAVKEAQKNVEAAEKAYSEAENAETKAADEVTKAKETAQSAFDDIEDQKEEYEDQIGAAEQDLILAEEALDVASSDLENKQSAAERALSDLDGELGKKINDLRKDISEMDENAEGMQDKVNELGALLVENFVLDGLSEEEKQAYENGDFSFEYSLDDSGRIVVTKVTFVPGSPEGYYSKDGTRYEEVLDLIDCKNVGDVIYGIRGGDFIPGSYENTAPEDDHDDGTLGEWKTYQYMSQEEESSYEYVVDDDNGQSYAKAIITRECEVTTHKRIEVLDKYGKCFQSSHCAQPETEAQMFLDDYEGQLTAFLAQAEFNGYQIESYTTESEEIRLEDAILFKCHLYLVLEKTETVNEFKVGERRYNILAFYHKGDTEDGYETENVMYSDSAVNDTVSDYTEKLADAEAARKEANDAAEAYNKAYNRVTVAREKLSSLKNAFISDGAIEALKASHRDIVGRFEKALEETKAKKAAAAQKISDAKAAIENAAEKIKAIEERIASEAQTLQNDDVDGDGDGTGVTPGGTGVEPGNGNNGPSGNTDNGNGGPSGNTDDGSSGNTDGGNRGSSGNNDDGNRGSSENDQPQVIQTAAGNAVTNTVSAVTPLVAGNQTTVTRTAPTTQRARMSSLAQSLSEDVYRQATQDSESGAAVAVTDMAKASEALGTDSDKQGALSVSENNDKTVAAEIDDNETALASSPVDGKTRLSIILAAIFATGAGVTTAELLRRKKEDDLF